MDYFDPTGICSSTYVASAGIPCAAAAGAGTGAVSPSSALFLVTCSSSLGGADLLTGSARSSCISSPGASCPVTWGAALSGSPWEADVMLGCMLSLLDAARLGSLDSGGSDLWYDATASGSLSKSIPGSSGSY